MVGSRLSKAPAMCTCNVISCFVVDPVNWLGGQGTVGGAATSEDDDGDNRDAENRPDRSGKVVR